MSRGYSRYSRKYLGSPLRSDLISYNGNRNLFHVLGVTGIDYRDGITVDGTYSWHRIDLVNHSVKPLAQSFQVNSMICRD